LKASFRYDERLTPPGPVLPFWVAAPGAEAGVLFQVLVDTGADCTLVPQATADALGLPAIDAVWVEGLGGAVRRATVHAARVEFGGVRRLARVVSFGGEAILGRDLLNRAVTLLDGPALTLSLAQQGPRRRRRGSSSR